MKLCGRAAGAHGEHAVADLTAVDDVVALAVRVQVVAERLLVLLDENVRSGDRGAGRVHAGRCPGWLGGAPAARGEAEDAAMTSATRMRDIGRP
jgi:hypothetical protein